jgi:hypothetical protein
MRKTHLVRQSPRPLTNKLTRLKRRRQVPYAAAATRASISSPRGHAAGHLLDETKRLAGQVVEGTKHSAGQVVEGTKHSASEASDRVTGAVTDKAVRQTITLMIGQKDDAALILAAAARALRETGARLYAQDKADVARTTERAAAQLTRFSGYLNTHDTEEIADDAERIAGAIPAGILSGALTVGLLAGRLLDKSDSSDT